MPVTVVTKEISRDQLASIVADKEFEGLLVAGVHEPDPLTWVRQLHSDYPEFTLRLAILHSVDELTDRSIALAGRRLGLNGISEGNVSPKRSFVIEQPARRVLVDRLRISFNPMELRLLIFFVQHPDVVFSRRELLHRLRSGERDVDPRMVDVLVASLRSKMDSHDPKHSHFSTVHGLGYRFLWRDDVFIDGFSGKGFRTWQGLL